MPTLHSATLGTYSRPRRRYEGLGEKVGKGRGARGLKRGKAGRGRQGQSVCGAEGEGKERREGIGSKNSAGGGGREREEERGQGQEWGRKKWGLPCGLPRS